MGLIGEGVRAIIQGVEHVLDAIADRFSGGQSEPGVPTAASGVPYKEPETNQQARTPDNGTAIDFGKEQQQSKLRHILGTLANIFNYAPIIIFLALQDSHFALSLGLAAVFSLAFLAVTFVEWRLHHRKIWPDNLNLGFFLVFGILWILTYPVADDWYKRWFNLIAMGAITAWILVGMLIGRPFCADFGKEATPQHVWDKPGFKRAMQIITSFWLVAFVIITACNLVIALTENNKKGQTAIQVIFNYVLPFGSLIIAWILTMWYVKRVKRARERAAQQQQASPPSMPDVTSLPGKDVTFVEERQQTVPPV